MISDLLAQMLVVVRDSKWYPDIAHVDPSCKDSQVCIGGRTYHNFSSNNYLGLAQHPAVLEAAREGLLTSGFGSGGSRLTAGSNYWHRALEERIAVFKGSEDAVVFSCGYLANTGILPALTGATLRSGIIALNRESRHIFQPIDFFADKLVHASIIDGISLAASKNSKRAITIQMYQHRDLVHLERLLSKSETQHKLIITDGVFSLHGRIAPLGDIILLAKRYGAEVYVDDAHGVGVLGESGRGTAEHFGVEHDVSFHVGTLSKALGGSGGYVAGTAALCDYLRIASRTYVFQTAMSSSMASGLIKAIELIEEEPERRERLLTKAAYVRENLIRLGFDIFDSVTQIIPVKFGETARAKKAAEYLFRKGFFAPCYYYPAVRQDEAMVRLNIAATHSQYQLDFLLEVLDEARKKFA